MALEDTAMAPLLLVEVGARLVRAGPKNAREGAIPVWDSGVLTDR